MDDRSYSELFDTVEQDPVIEEKSQKSKMRRLASLIWGVFAFAFTLGFLFNIYVIGNNILRKNAYSTTFGITPIVVAPPPEGQTYTGDVLKSGDLIFAVAKPYEDYEFGELIAFTYGDYILVGTIEDTEIAHGLSSFVVQSVTDDTVYDPTAAPDNTMGSIRLRLPLIGYFFLFLTTLWGRILFVGIPLLIYVILFFVGANDDLYEALPPEEELAPRKVRPTPDYIPTLGERVLSFASALVLTMAAIAYGTHADRKHKKQLAREAKAARKLAPYAVAPEVCRPMRMHAVHAVHPVRRRPVRPVKPVQRASVHPVSVVHPRSVSDLDQRSAR